MSQFNPSLEEILGHQYIRSYLTSDSTPRRMSRDRRDDQRPPRPPNAFIIFKIFTGLGGKDASALWHALEEAVRQRFHYAANCLVERHQTVYPFYAYEPRRTAPRARTPEASEAGGAPRSMGHSLLSSPASPRGVRFPGSFTRHSPPPPPPPPPTPYPIDYLQPQSTVSPYPQPASHTYSSSPSWLPSALSPYTQASHSPDAVMWSGRLSPPITPPAAYPEIPDAPNWTSPNVGYLGDEWYAQPQGPS